MKQVAFVDNNGEIAYIVTPGNDSDYIEGRVYGSYTAIDVAHDADITQFMSEYYWLGGDWYHRGPKPSNYHKWNTADFFWEVDEEKLFKEIRAQRDYFLKLSDWSQLPDVLMDDTKKEAWRLYRQALRDVPANSVGVTSMEEVAWPTEPV